MELESRIAVLLVNNLTHIKMGSRRRKKWSVMTMKDAASEDRSLEGKLD